MRTFGAFRAKTAGADLFYGEVIGTMVRRLREPYWLGLEPDGSPDAPLEDLEADVPVAPSKLIAVGRNYRAHAEERGAAVPTSPLTWLKAPSSLLASGGFVELPYPAHKVDFEAELGIVIGRAAKNVAPQAAAAHIFGYTACLDISDRDIQDSEKQFARAKSFDTFTPAGPYVYQGADASDLALTLHQNGTLRQNGRTSQMIFPVAEIVSFCSQGTTLLPGDVILTGTPSGVGAIHAGDLLETRIGPFAPLIVRVRDAMA
jgi:2-keto-4-pentenoate hydratase/2-oxohepta-3-ene-1,7-dioic acid hydratase in catechol pathway